MECGVWQHQPLTAQSVADEAAATLAPATVGFFPTLPTFVPAEPETEPLTTTTTTTTTTTRSSRFGLFRRKGVKRFRPRLQIQREEINEIEQSSDTVEDSRGAKLPRRLNRFRPSKSAIRRRPRPAASSPAPAPT